MLICIQVISQNIAGSLNQGGGSHRERQTGIMPMFRVDRPVKISKYEEKKKKKRFHNKVIWPF